VRKGRDVVNLESVQGFYRGGGGGGGGGWSCLIEGLRPESERCTLTHPREFVPKFCHQKGSTSNTPAMRGRCWYRGGPVVTGVQNN